MSLHLMGPILPTWSFACEVGTLLGKPAGSGCWACVVLCCKARLCPISPSALTVHNDWGVLLIFTCGLVSSACERMAPQLLRLAEAC